MKDIPPSPEGRSPTSRALSVMEWIANNPGATFGALSREFGLPKASAYRLVSELEEHGWVRKSSGMRNRKLLVGPTLTSLAFNVIRDRASSTGVVAVLRRLANSIGEACTIAVQDADSVVFVESIQPDKPLTFIYPAQGRAPLFCSSSGRIFMADMSDELLERYMRSSVREKFTAATITDEQKLRSIVNQVRVDGYASTESQWVANVVGAAVAIQDGRRRCIAALSFNAPDTRIPFERAGQFIPTLKEAAVEIGQELEAIQR
ncbi:IclR family transcriptional regulator [Parapusillimonas sp. SGNA-6]|nr:IclR family transcriptional regulator [Parapusillimonas sp. SGNA-6]